MPAKKCVLICDDDKGILEACRMILGEKYHVETTDGCENIIEYVEELNPDIILMDIRMPGGGENAVKKIHQTEDIKHIPVVVFSALDDIVEISERINATAIIEKPFDINTLMDTVRDNIL